MICVYDIGNENFEQNGDAILTPIKGSVRMIAGGNYTLSLVHPMDKDGKWLHLTEEAVIRAPVPRETIATAMSGLEADLYKTTAKTALREGPSEPTTITYTTWSVNAEYAVGSKVTWNNKNYQCNYYDETSPYAHISPPNCSWWVEIARTTKGSPVLVNLKSGKTLYYKSGPTDGWYKMMTTYGLEGYVKSTDVEYWKHVTPSETQPRDITTQLFRIKSVEADSEEKTVTVNARHVSYDMNGVLISEASIKRQQLPFALSMLEDAYMMDYRGQVATNITEDEDTSYTAEISGKSAMYAIMDPDKGLVKTFDAMLQRDNWDLFIMQRTNEDRGFRIRYGKNMKRVHWRINTDNLVTRVVPVAKDTNGKLLYLSGTKWENSYHINDYDTIYMERIKVEGQVGKDDGTETGTNWTASTLRAEMKKQAKARFKVDHADLPVHEITVEFEMQGESEEYAWMKNLQEVVLYDTVIAYHEGMNLSVSVTVEELEFDIVKEKITAAKMTNVKSYNCKNTSGFNVLNNSIDAKKLTDDVKDEMVGDLGEETLNTAVDQANSYTNGRISSYDSTIKAWVAENYVAK